MDLRICHAIAQRRLIEFRYNGVLRQVEPHLYGRTSKSGDVISGWLVDGGNVDGGNADAGYRSRWRTFVLDDLSDLKILGEHFAAPRDGFNPADPRFAMVYCRVDYSSESR
ncbi:MAG TPA: hypothetical protein VES88_15900 [Gemmatimonadaceae bacterium]|nr:hypothetical protein [Gemmatimonadaceae bacterium]